MHPDREQAAHIAAEAARRLTKLRRVLDAAGPAAYPATARRAYDDLHITISLLNELIEPPSPTPAAPSNSSA